MELHDAEENDNTALRAVMAKFRNLAIQHNLAVVLVHHARKGSGSSAGDPDNLRGASSIVGAARIVLTVLTMDEEQAAKLGIGAKDRALFPASTAPNPTTPHCRCRVVRAGGIRSRQRREGSRRRAVAAAERIRRPDRRHAQSGAGPDRSRPDAGHPYAPTKRGGSSRWCGQVLLDMTEMEEPRARQIIAQWLESGLLHKTAFDHPRASAKRAGRAGGQRKEAHGMSAQLPANGL